MDATLQVVLKIVSSWVSAGIIIAFCALSFALGEHVQDMNLFAASGSVMTVFGLLSLIRFTTIEKYLGQADIITSSTGITGPPLRPGEAEKIVQANRKAAKIRVTPELKAELRGTVLTIVGTLIWHMGHTCL